MKLQFVVALGVLGAAIAAPAGASLIGDEVDGGYYFGGNATNFFDPGFGTGLISETVLDGGNPEFAFNDPFSGGTVTADLGGESVWIEFTNFVSNGMASFDSTNTFVFENLNWLDDAGAPIAGEIIGIANVDGDAPVSDVFFTADSLTVVIDGFLLGAGESLALHLDLEVDHGEPNPVVPEPATVALMGIGLAGMAARKRLSF